MLSMMIDYHYRIVQADCPVCKYAAYMRASPTCSLSVDTDAKYTLPYSYF